jgi:FkbM family methyltransferase
MLQKSMESPLLKPVLHKLKLLKFLTQNQALKRELSLLPLLHSGHENINGRDFPFVVLNDKTVLYGRFPTSLERDMYLKWKSQISKHINADTIRVAMDVIMRYLYPHSMPHITMPYSRNQRRHFHNQHIETIKDLPNMSEIQKEELAKIFDIRKGENFLDVGAYMGFGDIRMSREIGPEGTIVAVEADDDARSLLELNIKTNNITNVIVVGAAASDHDGVETFYKTERQANSLISSVVDSDKSHEVRTLTIDSILKEASLPLINRISLTINGAEVEAVDGLKSAVENSEFLRVSAAGWYKRNGQRISDIIAPKLRGYGLQVAVGQDGGVLAWKQFKGV